MTPRALLYLSSLLLGAFAAATLTMGATPWDMVWQDVWLRLRGLGAAWNPLMDERLPRLIVLTCTGASLAVAGAVTQALFRNPLASPSVLGISAGGSLAAMLTLACGWHLSHPHTLALSACIGCMVSLVLVYAVAHRHSRSSMQSVIICGIALSTVLFAIRSSLAYALRDQWQLVLTLTEWEAGSSYDRSWEHVHLQLPLALIGLLGCWIYRREIDILALGEEEAANMGVAVHRIRWRLFACIALLTGGALAAMGVIAFFGLVLPHMVRLTTGPSMEKMLPLSTVLGATTLLGMDVLLRLSHIHAMAIGNVSAILGGVFFLMLLYQQLQLREV